MFLNIYFEKTDNVLPFNNQHQMNGVIAGILGANNKYHDTFSDYSVSSIQGGVASKDMTGIVFKDEPYIQVASNNNEFITEFVTGVLNVIADKSVNFFGLHITRFDSSEFAVKREYDVVKTISPILVKNSDGKKINCDDENWLEVITSHCKAKLGHLDINDDSFRIELKNLNNVRKKMIWVGDVFNPCTTAVMTIYGTKKARTAIYNMGFGNSTGSGFGAVKILT